MKVSLQYTSGATTSGYSVGVSMMCADLPLAPAAPTVLIKNLDQVVIEWQPPASDGGTPVLGYQVDMKKDGDAYTQIYDGAEDPGSRILYITEYNSAPLEVTTYYFRVRVLNWVGAGPDSAETTVILATQTSPRRQHRLRNRSRLDQRLRRGRRERSCKGRDRRRQRCRGRPIRTCSCEPLRTHLELRVRASCNNIRLVPR
mmetsp:Transcript_39217/g.44949  ORF Transcript_39217/g.44949 Transcript_39217/m.44949 type:complete len:201 (-) Transcript_39217:15099-15701(-)